MTAADPLLPSLTSRLRRPFADAIDPLVERLRRGEHEAIAETYDLHGAAILAMCRRILGDDALAEDVLQDVLVALPQAIERRYVRSRRILGDDALAEDVLQDVLVALPQAIEGFEGASSLRTYLLSIAVNHARHRIRAAVRRRAAMERYGREGVESMRDDGERRFDLSRALSLAFDELSEDQRVAFVLCEVEERTAGEAGAIVGAPEATMRTRVFHAKRKLRETLARRGLR
jgi:RNA polymerase sigma-70 factor (ECF subfamily)